MGLALILLCCNAGKSSEASMSETLEYLEKSFMQNLAALPWIASILLMLIELQCAVPYGQCKFSNRSYHTFITVTLDTTRAVAQISIQKHIDLVGFTRNSINMSIPFKFVVDGYTYKYVGDETSLMDMFSIKYVCRIGFLLFFTHICWGYNLR